MADTRAESYHSVIIVGAGISGLYAAQQLRHHFPDLLVVEASDDIGGRVQQVHGLAPWPVEAGPEFIHGAKSVLVDLVKEFGFGTEEKPWPDWWYFGKEGKLVAGDDAGDEVEQLHELFAGIGDETPPPPGQDISADVWLRSKGASDKMIAVAEACYANDFGCSLRQMGVREMIVENNSWDCGETYLIMDRSMRHLVDGLARGVAVRCSCPITSITYDASGAVLRGPAATLAARKVILTVPLAVLKAGRIAFQPALPERKAAAIARLRMNNAVKIVLAFSERFWPKDLYDVCCSDCFVPEFWSTEHTPVDAAGSHLHAIVGFLAGECADAVSAMPQQEAIDAFLQQLDRIFGSAARPRPASRSFVRGIVFDWSKQPWIGGAYSCPSYGAEEGDRQALAAPVLGTLFWGGEAAHEDVNPCMQAALEMGARAAQLVHAALQGPAQSKL